MGIFDHCFFKYSFCLFFYFLPLGLSVCFRLVCYFISHRSQGSFHFTCFFPSSSDWKISNDLILIFAYLISCLLICCWDSITFLKSFIVLYSYIISVWFLSLVSIDLLISPRERYFHTSFISLDLISFASLNIFKTGDLMSLYNKSNAWTSLRICIDF